MADEERLKFNTRLVADLFAGEDKRRLACPKCGHVQIVYQAFSDVGVSLAVDKQLLKGRLQKYGETTVDGYPCQMCENDRGVVQQTALHRGSRR